jgi:Bacterial Ig-like domain (group 2)
MPARFSIPPSLCAAIALLGACSSSPTGPAEPKLPDLPPGTTLFLIVAPNTATINGGHSLQMTVSRQNAHGQTIAPSEVVWASSNVTVARIGLDGTVTGMARGTAQISAQWQGMRGTSTVTVLGNEPPSVPCPDLAVAALGKPGQVPSKCGAP